MKKKNIFKSLIKYFNAYEIIWFVSLFITSIVLSILSPEESTNGVDGTIITILYFADVVICLLCELLTSKQSRWSFFIYNSVEIIEIIILIILKSRFATLAVSIFFWIPMHTISFINWNRHKDKKQSELTVVRSLKWWQSLILVSACVVWTVVVGYLVAAFGPETEFYSDSATVKAIAYIDSCVSAIGIADAILLYFRYKESWTIWYFSVILEMVINIICGQWVLLVLKVGYFTNTTYGLMKWTKYINLHPIEARGGDSTAYMLEIIKKPL